MTTLLMVLSKDPYTTETPDLVLDIGLNAKEKGIKHPKADAIACIKCTDARGVTKQQTEGVIIGRLYDLAEWTAESDKTILIG